MVDDPSYGGVVLPTFCKPNGLTELARLYSNFNPDAIPEYTNGRPYLHYACYKNHFTVVRKLLQCGASLLLRNHMGNSVLNYACFGREDSRMDMIAWLLLHHEDARSAVNWQNARGRTPLHITAIEGFTKGAIVLLNNGADTALKDNRGYTAALCANYATTGTAVVIENAENMISAGEWRPKIAGKFPDGYRYAMRTLVLLAKVE